jgi:uncharacterized protein (TIGR03086 family)
VPAARRRPARFDSDRAPELDAGGDRRHVGAAPYPDIAADRWVTEFDESTATMLATIDDDEAMGRTVGLAAGLTFPAPDVAVLAARNIFQFGWDLAGAIGHDLDLSPDLARELLDISRSRLVPQRGPNGFFGPEQIPPAGSPLATVLAGYLGCDV